MFLHQLYGKTVSAPVRLPAPPTHQQHADISITTDNGNADVHHAIGDPYSYVQNSDGSIRVVWLDQYEFTVARDGSTISARKLSSSHDDALYTHLLTQALSVALLQMGIEGLHGAALDLDGNAVVLLGDCGYGKSTLAAHALKRGARLLTDDLVVISQSCVLPGAQRLKLERHLGDRVLGERAIAPMNEGSDKWIFPLRDEEFAPNPALLKAIYVLQPHSEKLDLQRVSPALAFKDLVTATFNPLETSAARLQAHMGYIDQLVASAPLFHLSLPHDFEQIDRALDLVLK